jgi:hypothetical protein
MEEDPVRKLCQPSRNLHPPEPRAHKSRLPNLRHSIWNDQLLQSRTGGKGTLQCRQQFQKLIIPQFYTKRKSHVPTNKCHRPPPPCSIRREAAPPEAPKPFHPLARRPLPEGLRFFPQKKAPYPANEPPAAKARTLVSGSTNPSRQHTPAVMRHLPRSGSAGGTKIPPEG